MRAWGEVRRVRQVTAATRVARADGIDVAATILAIWMSIGVNIVDGGASGVATGAEGGRGAWALMVLLGAWWFWAAADIAYVD